MLYRLIELDVGTWWPSGPGSADRGVRLPTEADNLSASLSPSLSSLSCPLQYYPILSIIKAESGPKYIKKKLFLNERLCLRSLFLAGTNRCPVDAKCTKWTDFFPTPKSMCEDIWSRSYKYTKLTKASGQCMQLWFTGPNPNTKVAEYYLNGASKHQSFTVIAALLSILVACLFA